MTMYIDRLDRLRGVQPLLSATIILGAAKFWIGQDGRETRDWVRITEGLRSPERQRQLVADGKSRTLESKHLSGRAVDVAVMVGQSGKPDWGFETYRELNECIQQAASELGTYILWGGQWDTLRDGVHFELQRPPASRVDRFSVGQAR